jgi:hypothetical protein
MADESNAPTQTAERKRSPSYPSAGLETCVKWARKVWESEKKSATGALVVAKAMGYGSLSGASRVGISAMKKFGLLAEEGTDKVRLTEDAVKYFLLPDEDTKLALLRRLACKPPIIHEFIASHPDGLPSDDTLRYNLIAERDFIDEAATTFIKALRETVRFAKLDAADYRRDQMAPSPSEDVASAQPPAMTPARSARGFLETFGGSEARGRPSGALRVELSDGTWVSVEPSAPLTSSTFDELMDYLGVYKKVLLKRSAAEAAAAQSAPAVAEGQDVTDS